MRQLMPSAWSRHPQAVRDACYALRTRKPRTASATSALLSSRRPTVPPSMTAVVASAIRKVGACTRPISFLPSDSGRRRDGPLRPREQRWHRAQNVEESRDDRRDRNSGVVATTRPGASRRRQSRQSRSVPGSSAALARRHRRTVSTTTRADRPVADDAPPLRSR